MRYDYKFSSTAELRLWLQRKSDECGSPEAYDEWLQALFDDGNTVNVNGEEYDYWTCWEVL